MPANEDQIKFWNDRAGRDWTELQERMDANLSGIHGAIMAFAAPKPGEKVLDIGCGTGTTTMALADAVGPSGSVTGIDISVPMLGLAEARAQGRSNIQYRNADAAAKTFQPDFDLLFSRFGVMFFDDPVAAFANLRGALKPGGRLAFVCWRTPPENLWASAPIRAAKPFLPEMPPPDPVAPGPFAFADAARLTAVLEGAGFSGVEIEKYNGVMNMGTDMDRVAAHTLRLGPLQRLVGDADAAVQAKIADAVKTVLAEFQTSDGIAPPVACWLVSARP
jgi:SAM-dependent methyltransferase